MKKRVIRKIRKEYCGHLSTILLFTGELVYILIRRVDEKSIYGIDYEGREIAIALNKIVYLYHWITKRILIVDKTKFRKVS